MDRRRVGVERLQAPEQGGVVIRGRLDLAGDPAQEIAVRDLDQALERVEFLLGAGHGWQGAEWDRTWKETVEFFDATLKKR